MSWVCGCIDRTAGHHGKRSLEQPTEVNVHAFQPAGCESINHRLLTAQQRVKRCVKSRARQKNDVHMEHKVCEVYYAPVDAFIKYFKAILAFAFRAKCAKFKFR